MKDKAARDRRAQLFATAAAMTWTRFVLASPVDAYAWAGPYQDQRGRPCFAVSFVASPTEPPVYRVRCRGNDDFSIVRVFTDRERALAVFNGVNDFTQIKTLRRRGFRED